VKPINFNVRDFLKETGSVFFVIAFVFILASCDLDNKTHIKRNDVVPITSFFVPDSVAVSDTFEITATASVSNGCWKNLRFYFSKGNDTSYVLEARGTFESFGSCPSVEVSKDTAIKLSLAEKGAYYFYAVRNPYQYSVDTLMVLDSMLSGD
jgi:hypothetical protein